MITNSNSRNFAAAAVLVAALGYFVDVYDMLLFSIVRVASLQSLGLTGDELLSSGLRLLSIQMGGMLCGGIMWGIWGDKRGRVSVLFGSIFLYSLANIANGYVTNISQYGICRFAAGVGLAGELGAGITLVSELMDKRIRGWGTTIVASVGVAGAVVAALVGDTYQWRTSFFIGGGMGIALLILRVIVHESGLFDQLPDNVSRGNFFLLFKTRERFLRYLSCILTGLPIWFMIAILVTLAPEFGKALGMQELPSAGRGILFLYIGYVLGDLLSGTLSQLIGSRKKVLYIFLSLTAVTCFWYLHIYGASLQYFYTMCSAMGFAGGYWAVFVSTAAEQFGTNLRATVTTTVPNFIRGSVVPITALFNGLRGSFGIIHSALYILVLCVLIAFIAVYHLEESFGRDLDFIET